MRRILHWRNIITAIMAEQKIGIALVSISSPRKVGLDYICTLDSCILSFHTFHSFFTSYLKFILNSTLSSYLWLCPLSSIYKLLLFATLLHLLLSFSFLLRFSSLSHSSTVTIFYPFSFTTSSISTRLRTLLHSLTRCSSVFNLSPHRPQLRFSSFSQ